MQQGRTVNSIRNIISGLLGKIVTLVYPFIIRTVIIYSLGVEYLGLGGLFSSILQVLNMAELGFSTAIVYNMYEPIANNDKSKICSLMTLYRNIYRVIGGIILVFGIFVSFFIDNFISGSYPDDINIYVLFYMYLFNTVISYFLFAYRSCLFTAHQRSDIVNNIQTTVIFFQYTIQLFILLFLKNYYFYFIITPIFTILNNCLAGIYSKKKYPQYKCDGNVSKNDRAGIVKHVSGLMIQKLSAVSRNSFDNIFISAFLGLAASAMYSNYYYIMSSVYSIIAIVISSLTASVGNSLLIESQEKNYKDFHKISFVYLWIAGWFSICLYCLYQPFMYLWVGKGLLLPKTTMILFCIYFYQNCFGDIFSLYIQAAGLWWKVKHIYALNALANILLNYILVRLWGIWGVLIATIITGLFIGSLSIGKALFDNYFKDYFYSKYLTEKLIFSLIVIGIAFITDYCIGILSISDSIFGFIIKILICFILPNSILVCVFHNNHLFIGIKELVFNLSRMLLGSIKDKLNQ